MDKKKMKPYVAAILLIVLYVAEIFWLSDILGANLGLAGTVLHEIVLALIAVFVFVLMRGKLKIIFPFKKPEFKKLSGTVVLWLGAYMGTMVITIFIAYFFPEEMLGVSQGIQEIIMETPVWISILVVAVTPAVCEEIAFRGALLSCFRGIKNRWIGIVIVAGIFGACHGSVWRLVPTMMLGIAMGYLLFETENMIYPMLFHFVNNLVPVIALTVMSGLRDLEGTEGLMGSSMLAGTEVPFASVAMYIMYGGAVPLLIYVGNYLIHSGETGYENGLFPREKQKILIILISVSLGMFLFGAVLMGISVVRNMSYYMY